MSIGKSQAKALADGFLDSFGTGKEDLQPRETFTEVILLAGELIEESQKNLNQANTNASGALSASLVANEPVQVGNGLKVDVMMNFYGRFVNKGVRGTKGGSGLYAFKYDKPSRKMVEAIMEWQKRGKSSTSNVNARKSTSRNEVKNSNISQIDSAYAVARSIVQKGIKATGFLDKAIVTTQGKVRDRLGLALKIDVTNYLNNI